MIEVIAVDGGKSKVINKGAVSSELACGCLVAVTLVLEMVQLKRVQGRGPWLPRDLSVWKAVNCA